MEEARRLVRQAMSAWGLGEQSETAALLISELVTNAITSVTTLADGKAKAPADTAVWFTTA